MCVSAGVGVPCAIRHLQLQHLTCSVGAHAQHTKRCVTGVFGVCVTMLQSAAVECLISCIGV